MDMATIVQRVHDALPGVSETKVGELIDRAQDYFLTETKRKEVPGRAAWLIVDLAVAYYRQDVENGKAPVSSIKRGDTTISYANVIDAPRYSFKSLDKRVAGFNVVRAV